MSWSSAVQWGSNVTTSWVPFQQCLSSFHQDIAFLHWLWRAPKNTYWQCDCNPRCFQGCTDRGDSVQTLTRAKDCIAASQVNMAKLENRHRRFVCKCIKSVLPYRVYAVNLESTKWFFESHVLLDRLHLSVRTKRINYVTNSGFVQYACRCFIYEAMFLYLQCTVHGWVSVSLVLVEATCMQNIKWVTA